MSVTHPPAAPEVNEVDASDLRASLAARGLERSARFSWERTARRTLEAYHRVLDSARRAR